MKKNLGIKILVFSFLFFVSFLLFFPLNNLRGYLSDQIYKSSGILLVSDSMYFSLLGMPGLGFNNVSISLPTGEQELEFSSQSAKVKFAMSGIFPPLPGISVRLSGLKKGGEVYARVGRLGSLLTFFVETEKVNLDQLGMKNAAMPLKGWLDIKSDLRLDESDLNRSSGYLNIGVSDFKINQYTVSPPDPSMAAFSFIIPAMKIGKLSGNLTMKNGVLEISQFKFGEDPSSDFKGSVAGDFKLEKNFGQSHLNIIVKIKLSERILNNPDARTFISFLNSYQIGNGEYGLKWNALMDDFNRFSIKAIPEKL